MDLERQRLLERHGYKVRTYERVIPPAGDDSATADIWPKVKSAIEPGADNYLVDYDSFPAVYSPNGTPVRPYQADGRTPNPIDVQWDFAWEQHFKRTNKKGYKP